jgi:hypothetical protein
VVFCFDPSTATPGIAAIVAWTAGESWLPASHSMGVVLVTAAMAEVNAGVISAVVPNSVSSPVFTIRSAW